MNKHIKFITVCALLFFLLIPICSVLAANIYGMPSWYPESPETFQDFHGKNLKRVVDNANLLTVEEEEALSEKAEELSEKYDKGFVILTDKSSYGLSKEVYAADFFIFNGYGVGDNYSGVILFLFM